MTSTMYPHAILSNGRRVDFPFEVTMLVEGYPTPVTVVAQMPNGVFIGYHHNVHSLGNKTAYRAITLEEAVITGSFQEDMAAYVQKLRGLGSHNMDAMTAFRATRRKIEGIKYLRAVIGPLNLTEAKSLYEYIEAKNITR